MTDKPTADEALPFEPYGAQIPDEEKARIRKTSLYERGDTICVWINEGSLHHVQAQLTAALARAEAAEARIAVLCEEIDMKEGVLSALRTRAEAAEKALEDIARKLRIPTKWLLSPVAAPEAPSDAAARGAQSLGWILDELRNGEATDHDIARRLVDAEPDIRAALAALRGQTGVK
jgi:hypothetical protein